MLKIAVALLFSDCQLVDNSIARKFNFNKIVDSRGKKIAIANSGIKRNRRFKSRQLINVGRIDWKKRRVDRLLIQK